jgi:hypothetical protein
MMKRLKRPTVQLTSLLDLLFVMIFVSLIQSKEVPKQAEPEPAPPAPKVTKPEVVVKPEVKPEVKPRPVQYSVTATFHFYGPKSNPGLPEGKYAMQGRYNRKTGSLQLGGLGWLDRPEGYDMVPLSGEIKDGSDIFRGRIEFQQCETFTLQRTAKTGETPISGTWKGLYTCSQGETGLTLTIE